jgi:peptidoglycan/LPS O-acetylase OafA/YrhL
VSGVRSPELTGPPAPASAPSGERRKGGIARIPALDGIRAFAVIAVLLFHAGISWIPGGSLGVDVFFVLSGFLITALLVSEHSRSGAIKLGSFYIRRIRRLFPAFLLVLLFVVVTWGLLLETKTTTLRGDALATLFYVANWHFAFSGQGYFASFTAPSPLLHTWSLSVEEQFYVVWPPVVTFLLWRGRSVMRWALGLVTLAFTATLIQSLAGVWVDRLYYGTDTRVIPLLLGAALGAWFVGRPDDWEMGRRAGIALQVAGLTAAAAVGWFWCIVPGQSTGLYRGGFLALAACVVVIIASVALFPRGILSRGLSIQPLRYIGLISYGIYLWHWPIFLLLTHQRTGLSGVGLLALRCGVTLVLAMLSYHFVELPIRHGRLRLPKPKFTAPIAIAALVGLLLAATPAPSVPVVAAPPTLHLPPANAPLVDTSLGLPSPPGTSRVLFVGDSVALSLADALARNQQAYSIHIGNAGLLGCGIALGSPRRFRGTDSNDPSFCLRWPQLRAQQVKQDHPALVAVLVGEWELMDRMRDGRWQHITQPAYDSYLAHQLDLLINVLSAGGARVALLTTPCTAPAESPSGALWPENDPQRLARFNELLHQAAARQPTKATVVDLKAMVCPGGHFTDTLDGETIRSADGIHFPKSAIPPVAAQLLPKLRQLAVRPPNH